MSASAAAGSMLLVASSLQWSLNTTGSRWIHGAAHLEHDKSKTAVMMRLDDRIMRRKSYWSLDAHLFSIFTLRLFYIMMVLFYLTSTCLAYGCSYTILPKVAALILMM